MELLGKQLKSYCVITFGVFLTAVGVYFFKFPNNFSTGGVTGIATILGGLFPSVTKGDFVTVINIALLLLGFAVFGRGFAFKTVYTSLLLSLLLSAFERLLPMAAPLTDQKLLELIFAILLIGVGSALLFSERASSGGTDIVAMILKKFTALDIGKALHCTDFMIAVAAGVVFGIETGLFSLLGLLAKAFVVDNFIDSIYLSKSLSIVTNKPDEICAYITEQLHRSATTVACTGSYAHEARTMAITVLSRSQAVQLKDYAKTLDPQLFIITTNSSDILGKGFRENVG